MADEDEERPGPRFAFTTGPLAHQPPPAEGQHDLAYEHYIKDLNAKRDLWNRAQDHAHQASIYGSYADAAEKESGSGDYWRRRQEKESRKYEGAKAAAKHFGVDVEKPQPRDEAGMTRPWRPRSPGFDFAGTSD